VVERHYGWKAGLPAYGLAAAMGYSRIVRDKHYLSDVVAGAALGSLVGLTVTRVNSRPLAPGPGVRATWNVTPIVARHQRGLQLAVAF